MIRDVQRESHIQHCRISAEDEAEAGVDSAKDQAQDATYNPGHAKMSKILSFKYRVQRLLEARGFIVACITDSMLPIDLVAFQPNRVCGYCCKAHGHVYDAELAKLQSFAHKAGLEVLIAREQPGREIYFQKIPPFRDERASDVKARTEGE